MAQSHGSMKHLHEQHKHKFRVGEWIHAVRFMNRYDKIMFFVGIIGPLTTIPQLINIWIFKQTLGVSMLTWIFYLVASSMWLLYAFMHEEKPLIVTNSVWVLIEIILIVGLIIY